MYYPIILKTRGELKCVGRQIILTTRGKLKCVGRQIILTTRGELTCVGGQTILILPVSSSICNTGTDTGKN
jgi:hypothetical protein